MGYQAPLSERVRIQLEILWENFTDCLPSMSSASYKKPLMLLVAVMAFATLRHSRRDVKAYGGYGGYGGGGGYGGYSTTTKKRGFFDRVFRRNSKGGGKYGGGYGSYGTSSFGGDDEDGYGAGGGGSAAAPRRTLPD